MGSGNIVSVYGGHDANISFYNGDTGSIHVIELERLTQSRYFRLHVDNSRREIRSILKQSLTIAEDHWGIKNNFETLLIGSDGWNAPRYLLRQVFNYRDAETIATHHKTHAASAYYQSPYEEALIISFDGGGDDGFFNIYRGDRDGIRFLERIDCDFGGGYTFLASLIEEVTKDSRNGLALAGKLMGLCAYGNSQSDLEGLFAEFYFNRDFQKIIDKLGLEFPKDYKPWTLKDYKYKGQKAFDIAATAQKAFEKAFFQVLEKYDNNIPICITGGCGLNVLLNEKIKNDFNPQVFVPPNPNDCGLSVGHLFEFIKPKEQLSLTYSGMPLVDRNELEDRIEEYSAKKVNMSQVAQLLKEGKILGFVYGDSEVGPRALGNRSIVCNPSFPQMKDVLNLKVKFREWYRPFAPFCRIEDSMKYFESRNFDNLEFMSFAPDVKDEWRSFLPSITHIDGTSRLQTVTKSSHSKFHELLTEFSQIAEIPVLLNTSFNIRGKPILSSIEDAIKVLETTELDGVVIEDYLFLKNGKYF